MTDELKELREINSELLNACQHLLTLARQMHDGHPNIVLDFIAPQAIKRAKRSRK